MRKAKALSKKMGMTINDMMMGLTSKVLKQYFVSKGDSTDTITVGLPLTFKNIAKKVKDYTYGNKFASLTVYMKLIDNFEKASQTCAK